MVSTDFLFKKKSNKILKWTVSLMMFTYFTTKWIFNTFSTMKTMKTYEKKNIENSHYNRVYFIEKLFSFYSILLFQFDTSPIEVKQKIIMSYWRLIRGPKKKEKKKQDVETIKIENIIIINIIYISCAK